MIFAYNHQGVTMTYKVPCERSITGVYYSAFMQKLRRKMNKNRPQLLVAGPLILHDNAHSHIADIVMPVAHGKIFCQIYFIKCFMKQNFIKCTLLMEIFYKILSFIKYFTK